MTQKAPGKSHREGMSLIQAMRKFPSDAAAEAWFARIRWPHGPACPKCGSVNVQSDASHPTMPYRCREKECGRTRFSVKTGTVMESSKLGYQTWAIAIYLFLTNLKSVSSMKLHRDLDITQKSAWHLAHRLRKAFETNGGVFLGSVEVDETYVGGRRANMPKGKRAAMEGRGAVGKTAVIGAKDRASNQVRARVIQRTDAETLQGFVVEHADAFATVYTDDASAYAGLPHRHGTVKHSLDEYVKGDVHTNGIESFWSMLKRAHKGTFHKLSAKHLNRYVQEFAAKHNLRDQDTAELMASVVLGMDGKRLPYKALKADNGLSSGVRA